MTKPRSLSISGASAPHFSNLHPLFDTFRFLTVTKAPGHALMTSAPSSSRLSILTPAPSTIKALLAEVTLSPLPALPLSSSKVHAKDGCKTTLGPEGTTMSLAEKSTGAAISAPASSRTLAAHP